MGLKFLVAHPPSDDHVWCDRAQKHISRSTWNKEWRLKSWGSTPKSVTLVKKPMHTMVLLVDCCMGIGWLLYGNWAIDMLRIESRCQFFNPTSVQRDMAANRNWHFQFICYFSTNIEDTLVLIAPFDPSCNSASIWCVTLLQAVAGTSLFP